ncbi:hypothetical protein GCM10023084_41880 [Streptomyces lacrimifluminis]|uniref:Recombinase domain-containing protein n=1 Tax=Streptomyces lacrimifluminis TaxID=1500077 RepID=A0A917NMI0_9ACTN|nr:hypothetical protein GCM10012282_04470 [Streptomyces lacrimifluminis]
MVPRGPRRAIRGTHGRVVGYRKAPHPSGSGWCLTPDPESTTVVRTIVEEVHAGLSLIAIARKLNETGALVPRDRHAQLQGRPLGGRRHGRDFERFRWTSGTLSKVLRSPSLMGHRVHQRQTVQTVHDATGAPVLIGPPLLTESAFHLLQAVLLARSNGTRRKRWTANALLTGVAHCAGCKGRMYFALRKGYPYGDYGCRATARGDVCPAPSSVRSDWLEEYVLSHYHQTAPAEAEVTREALLRDGVRVTVAKGRKGGDAKRMTGPDTSRLAFTMQAPPAVRPEN